jgi:hypothetical protein
MHKYLSFIGALLINPENFEPGLRTGDCRNVFDFQPRADDPAKEDGR